jgi:hypothetical protein
MNYDTVKQQYNYSYKTNKPTSNILIFELRLNNYDSSKSIIKRCIKKTASGNILSSEDTIYYNQYNNFELTIIDADNVNNIIIIKDNIIKNDIQTIVSDDKIFLEINNKNNYMIFNYNLFFT